MEKIPPIGERLSPILVEIEETLWEHEATLATKPEYTLAGFRAAAKIFMSAMMDYTYSRNAAIGMNMGQMTADVENLGKEVRGIILKYTGIDSVKLYNSDEKRSN